MKLVMSSDGRLRIAGARARATELSVGVSPDTMDILDWVPSHTGVKPIVQRSAGTETGDVPVMFTYTGAAPSSPQARVVAAVGGAVVKDWATLSSITAASGNGIGYLDAVPQGDGYLLELRDGLNTSNAATNSAGAIQFGIGPVILFMGQSNAVGTLLAGDSSDIVPGTASSEYNYYNSAAVAGRLFDNNGWHRPSNGGGGDGPGGISSISGGSFAFLRIIADALEVEHGQTVPVGLIAWAHGATSIGQFSPGGSKYVELFDAADTDIGDIGFASQKNIIGTGDFEACLWHQGESDQSLDAAAYNTALQVLYQGLLDHVAQFGRDADSLWFFPAVIGIYNVASVPNVERTRRGILQFEAYAASNDWPLAQVGWTTIDCDPDVSSDGLHFTDANGYRYRSIRRAIQSVLYALGCATFSGRGPTLGGYTRSGDVATFDVVHDGGAALELPTPGSPVTGFAANTAADFSGSAVTVTAALVNSNTQIALTFAGGTSYPVYVKYMGALVGSAASAHPDVTNCVYDNASYPSTATGTDVEALGLPLLPTDGAVTVS